MEITAITMSCIDGSAADFTKGKNPDLDSFIKKLEDNITSLDDYPNGEIKISDLPLSLHTGVQLFLSIIGDDRRPPPTYLSLFGRINDQTIVLAFSNSDDTFISIKPTDY